ncbi:normal mucosa of esophagus-specific gene 1 protein isoform X2 [Hydra vulgaris]|uniref:Normal mucosa of esophagus-specific gene 1 protein isoform X2 n=1 Tax=Hydra vulgaris TaxID=6087 RepID=A0ABM4DGS9_HYDVU
MFFASMKLGDKLAVAPLIGCISVAATLAVGSCIRGLRAPDVVLSRSRNPTPWNQISPTQQVKMFSPYDYSKLESAVPPESLESLK